MNSQKGRKTAVPRLEALETRTMMTAAPAIVPTAEADRRYVEALVGDVGPSQPVLESLADRMVRDLGRGVGRERVVRGMLESTPADLDRVGGVYRELLRRDPTAQELRRGKAMLDRGQDVRALAKQLAGSPEFYNQIAGGTGSGFVTALDRILLGRNPTGAELAVAEAQAGRPIARRRIASAVVDGAEFRENMARGVLAERGSPIDAAELARAVRLLAAPSGYVRLQAAVLGSQPVYDELSASSTAPTAAPVAGDGPAPLSLVPSFTSSSAPLVAPPSGGSYPVTTAGADGSFYVGGPGGLLIYHPTNLFWSSIGDGAPVASASALSYNEIWAVETPSGGTPTLVHYVGGQAVGVPTLPGGVVPQQVSAAADGTVWMVDGNGSILTLSAGATSWTPMAGPGGAPVSAVAVGSAENTWALSGPAGATQLFRFTGQYGWIPDPTFAPGAISSIDACADGSSWLVAGGVAYVHPSVGYWYTPDPLTLPNNLVNLAPYSQLQAYSVNNLGFGLPPYVLSSIGLVDQQPNEPYPTWTASQQAIYTYISQQVQGADIPGGVRAQYTNLEVSVDSWGTQIGRMAIPPQFSTADWNVVVTQLLKEFGAVDNVNNLFTQINGLDSAIEGAQALMLSGIQSIILASNPGPQTSTYITLAIEGLIEAVVAGVGVAAGPEAAIAAAVIDSALSTASSEVNAALGGGGGNQAQVQYGLFAQTQATIFDTADTVNGGYQQSILGDYGRLMAVAYLVNSGTWSWDPSITPTLVNGAMPAYQLYDYQSLVPPQWQVVEFEYTDYFHLSVHKIEDAFGFASDATIATENGHHLGAPKYDFLFSNQVGAHTDLNKAPFVSFGPYPTSALFTAIGNLPGQSVGDFWSRTNGWNNVNYVRAPSQPSS